MHNEYRKRESGTKGTFLVSGFTQAWDDVKSVRTQVWGHSPSSTTSAFTWVVKSTRRQILKGWCHPGDDSLLTGETTSAWWDTPVGKQLLFP